MSHRRDIHVSRDLDTLLKLVQEGAGDGYADISSGRLAKSLNLTQQAASRRLIDLEKAGLISRTHAGRSLRVRLTPDGMRTVRSFYGELKSTIERTPRRLTFTGTVFSGIGKGKYYVGHPEYQKRFGVALGYRPYPGTLNVKLEDRFVEQLRELRSMGGIRVEGFTRGKEGFSALTCFNGVLSGERVTLLFIDITHYNESVVELISPAYLRGKFNLKDGDRVTFTTDEPSLVSSDGLI